MATLSTPVFDDLKLTNGCTTVRRFTSTSWHGIVGSQILCKDSWKFKVKIEFHPGDGALCVGVADATVGFSKNKGGKAWGISLMDGVVCSTKNAAGEPGDNGQVFAHFALPDDGDDDCICVLEIKVDMVQGQLAFRNEGTAEWASWAVPFPRLVRPWLLLGDVSSKVTLFPAVAERPASHHEQMVAGLVGDMGSLCCSDAFSDVAIIVGGTKIAAHACVLSVRSKVFAAMLGTPMRESVDREIFLTDIEVPAARALLSYLYTGQVQANYLEDDCGVMAVLSAAHRFELPLLEEHCAQKAKAMLRPENVSEFLQSADSLGCTILREACMDFMVEHLDEVKSTEGFKRLAEKRPSLMVDVVSAVAPLLKKCRRS